MAANHRSFSTGHGPQFNTSFYNDSSFTLNNSDINPSYTGLPTRDKKKAHPQELPRLPGYTQTRGDKSFEEDDPIRKRVIPKNRGQSDNILPVLSELANDRQKGDKRFNGAGAASDIRGLNKKMTILCEEFNNRLEAFVYEKKTLNGDVEGYMRYSTKLLEQMEFTMERLREIQAGLSKSDRETEKTITELQAENNALKMRDQKRDQRPVGATNMVHSYQQMLALERENSQLKKDVAALLQKLKENDGVKNDYDVEGLLKENRELKQKLDVAEQKLQYRSVSPSVNRDGNEPGDQQKTYGSPPGKSKHAGVDRIQWLDLKWNTEGDRERDDYAKNELLKLEMELRAGQEKNILGNELFMKDVFIRLNKIGELLNREKAVYRAQIRELQKAATEKIESLKAELSKEGVHMDTEVGKLQSEVAEWKKENQMMADVIRRQKETIGGLQKDLTAISREKMKLVNDTLQHKAVNSQLERQVQELAMQLTGTRQLPSIPVVNNNLTVPQQGADIIPVSNASDPLSKSPSKGAPSQTDGLTKTRNDVDSIWGGNANSTSTKPKTRGRRYVGFTGDWEMYKRKNEDMLGTVNSLSEFYEGLLRLGEMDPKIVKKAMAGGVGNAIGRAAKGSFMESPQEEDEDEQAAGKGGNQPKVQNNTDGFTGKVWGTTLVKKDAEGNEEGVTGETEERDEGDLGEGEEDQENENREQATEEEDMIEELPMVLPEKYNLGELLPPMRPGASVTFLEVAKRWKASDRDDATRTKLLEMLKELQYLKDEALDSQYIRDLLIILKTALKSEKPLVYQAGAKLLADLVANKRITKKNFKSVEPMGALAKCLVPPVGREDAESLASRVSAALDILIFMSDVKFPWNLEMMQLLVQKNCLITVLKTLQSKNEWQVVQATRAILYIIENKELIKEIRDLNGMSFLILNLESTNRTIRMNVVKALSLMMNDIETRERYLAKKDNKLDEVLSKIMENEPEFMRYLLDILANLIKNNDFASLLIDDPDEFEQLMAILDDVDSDDCKNGVYKILQILGDDVDVQKKIYTSGHKIFVKHLMGNPKEYAFNLLTTLDLAISQESKRPLDQEIFQSIIAFLKKTDQTNKATITLAIKVLGVLLERNGPTFHEWVVTNSMQDGLVSVYLGPIRDNKITVGLNNLFAIFLCNKELKRAFLSTSGPLVLKSMLDQLRKKDEIVRMSAIYNLQYILEESVYHRFINTPDLRKIMDILNIKADKAYLKSDSPNEQLEITSVVTENKMKCVLYALSLLTHLTTREEFMQTFTRFDLQTIVLTVLRVSELPPKGINDALSILQHILSSTYGKNAVRKIYQVEGIMGLEMLSSLCLPPIDTNDAAKNAAPVWGCLADEFDDHSLESLKQLKDKTVKMFENLAYVLGSEEVIPALRASVAKYVSFCEEDPSLAEIIEATRRMVAANPPLSMQNTRNPKKDDMQSKGQSIKKDDTSVNRKV